jgi:hypothetical protein
MSTNQNGVRRSAVAALWLGALGAFLTANPGAASTTPVAAAAMTTVVASDGARGYHRYPYSRYRPYGYRHYSYYRPYYRPYYYSYPFAFYGAWGYPATYGQYGYEWSPDAGALDLNIKPKRAEVWVDREYLGTVDSYDGFPRYLWLRSGQHHVVVYLDGYETFAREVTLRAGEVLAVRFELREGVGKKPDELFASLPEPEEREPRAVREPAASSERRVERPRDDWRDRGRDARMDSDQRAEPGRLRLVVAPEDAVVYLDGRLIGSGEDLRRLHADLLVDAGPHRLEASRPGYRTWQREIEVGEGEELVVRAELEPDR